jgi:hypothetical protein
MSRIEYSWQVALQQSLLPLPRSTQPTRVFYVRSVSDPPAGPCVSWTVHGNFGSQYTLPSVSRSARFTITQSSWTAPSQRCSRKWMSGHAAIALVLLRDRGQFATLTIRPLGEPIPPSQGESPFPLDFYLSWMSTKLPPSYGSIRTATPSARVSMDHVEVGRSRKESYRQSGTVASGFKVSPDLLCAARFNRLLISRTHPA